MKLQSLLAKIFYLLLILSIAQHVNAQSFVHFDEVDAFDGSTQLLNPWAGGLKNPQFSDFDMNLDGMEDLFVFDRQGNKAMIFLHDGVGAERGYDLRPELEELIPQLQDWAILRDMNCDGLPELITGRNQGVAIYPAFIDNGLVNWTVDTSRLTYDDSGFDLFIGVTEIDIPSFEDIDFDGDMDMLTFNLGGGFVELYENIADQSGDPCGTPEFILSDNCWGDFYESGFTNVVELDSCGTGRPAPSSESERNGVHAGSTLMTFDENADGLYDLILGDLSNDKLNRLINGGAVDDAHITFQDPDYPSSDVSYNQNSFPAAFYVDADRDGQKDMLVCPNSPDRGAGYRNVWWYKDVNAGDEVEFSFQIDSFLNGDMAEHGSGAAPVFFDHNGDGLLDIVVGNSAYIPNDIANKYSSLALWENVGSASLPAYRLITRDYANLSIFQFTDIHPSFGDLDGDGDIDMLIGEESGSLHFFANFPAGSTASFTLLIPGYQSIDPGIASTPNLFDIDRDNDLDLIIGERNGNLNFYRNEGSSTSANFVEESTFFGAIDLSSGTSNVGYTQTWITEEDGEFVMYVGEERGRIYRYEGFEADLAGTFTATDSLYAGVYEGFRSRICLADINNDGNLEIALGNMRGGFSLFREGEYVVGEEEVNLDLSWKVFPNPSSGLYYLQVPESWIGDEWVLYDLRGALIQSGQILAANQELDLQTAGSGIYLLHIPAKGQIEKLLRP
jgi:hypothetical protein